VVSRARNGFPHEGVRPALWAVLAALLLALALVGCSRNDWRTKDISGLMPSLKFQLTAESGKQVTAADYEGRVVLLYFGYTRCPDVCPTTLARFKRALDRLGKAGRDVTLLFVTVDPKRDDLQTLRQYTNAFDPRFVGLRGDKESLDSLTKRYRVTYGYGKPDDSGNYEVSHSSAVFAFDREGKARLLFRSTDSLDDVVADLRRLVGKE